MSAPEDRDPPTPPSSRELLATLILRMEDRQQAIVDLLQRAEQERTQHRDRVAEAVRSTDAAHDGMRLELATLRSAVEARVAAAREADQRSGEFWGRALTFLTAPATIAAMSGPASVAVYLLFRALGMSVPTEPKP